MPVTVKVMSDEPHPDDDSRRTHTLFTDIREVHFERKPDGTPWLTLRRSGFDIDREDDATSFEPKGNVYVMNDAGRTVSTFGVCPIPRDFDHTIFINGRPVTDLRLDGPISVSLLRELVEVPAPNHLIRVGENGYDLIPNAGEARVFPVNGDRFLTDLAAA